MTELVTILSVLGYAGTNLNFFNQVHQLDTKHFQDARLLLQDIHSLVVYQADKTLIGGINAKYDRFVDILEHWNTTDANTKRAFAMEILEGDASVDNEIRRFQTSAYAPGGYYEEETKNILSDKHASHPKRLVLHMITDNMAIEELKKFFPTLLEVEMKATTLIFFGYYMEQSLSGKTKLVISYGSNLTCPCFAESDGSQTDIKIVKQNSDLRMSFLKSKVDETMAKADQKVRVKRQFNEIYDGLDKATNATKIAVGTVEGFFKLFGG